LRPVRIQQVARRRILGAVLSDGVAQGALRARVPVGAVVLRDRQYRQRRTLHQRGARARPRGAAAGRQRVRVQVHGGRRLPAPLPTPRALLPDVAPWSEHDRLTREKAVLGFFISGHPLARYRVEVELFGTRTTATLGQWSDQRVRIGAVVTVLKRQISKKTGAEYARLTLEDFHGTAEALVFPEAWAKLNEVIRADRALLLAGSYSGRDRDEEQAPFIVETAQALDELKASGAIGIALRWSPGAPPPPDATRA